MKGVRVFVSGGAGVIGQEMIPRLVERGAEIFTGDLKPRPGIFPKSVYYRQGDLNTLTCGELRAFSPQIFIHLAATFERSTESYGHWDDNFWNNVQLSHHLMTLHKDLPCLQRVVFASSYLIYNPALYQFPGPRATAVSLREDAQIFPRNLTGMAKLSHEIELQFLQCFKSGQFTSVCARIYRGYGRGSRDVISRWIRSLLAGEPVSIYQTEGIFDYIYAADSAEGLIRLADREDLTGIINLGTGIGRRVGDILDILREYFPDIQQHHRVSDALYEASCADMTLYQEKIGWRPEYSLETAIPEIIEYEKARISVRPDSQGKLGNILITSASRKTPLICAMQKAARRLNPDSLIIAGDANSNARTRYVADEFWQMPITCEEVITDLLHGCKERGVNVVLPTRDGELEFWSRHAQRFSEAGIHVVISPLESVRLCLDKFAFARFGLNQGFPFIPAYTDISEVSSDRFVVKERYGAGARFIGLDLDYKAAVAHARSLDAPIFQPFVEGREASIDAWLSSTYEIKGIVLRWRDQVIDGESAVTTTFRDQQLEALACTVLRELKLCGPVVMQVLVDSAGDFHIIECNPRTGGASTTGIAAGLDSLGWSLLESIGVDIKQVPFDRVPGEVRLVRVAHDLVSYDSDF